MGIIPYIKIKLSRNKQADILRNFGRKVKAGTCNSGGALEKSIDASNRQFFGFSRKRFPKELTKEGRGRAYRINVNINYSATLCVFGEKHQ